MSVIIKLNAVLPNLPQNVTHLSTDWEIATDQAFTNVVHQNLGDTTNKLEYLVILSGNPPFYGRSRINTSAGTIDWSDATPCYSSIKKPEITISGEPNNIQLNPSFDTDDFTVLSGSDTHVKTDWIVIEKDTNIRIFENLNDYNNLTSFTMPIGILTPGKEYSVLVKYYGNNGISPIGSKDFIVDEDAVSIATPIISIEGEPSNISLSPTITTSPFTVVKGSDTHVATTWILRDDNGNIILSSYNNTINKTSFTLPNNLLSPDTSYTIEVKHIGVNTESNFSIRDFITLNIAVDTPVLTVQGEPTNVPSGPTINTSNFNVTQGSDTHVSTDWIVTTTTGTVVYQSIGDTTNLTNITLPPGTLQFNTTYEFKARFHGNLYTTAFGVKQATTAQLVVIDTPSVTVQGEPSSVPTGPQLSSTPFSVSSGSDTHQSTDWIITDLNNNVIWNSLADTTNLTSIQVPSNTLQANTPYIVKVKYNGAIAASNYGTKNFTTLSIIISDPVIYITGEPNNVPANPTITTDPFNVTQGTDNHYATDWIVLDINNNIVHQSLNDTVNLTSYNIPTSSPLQPGQQYIIKVRHIGNNSASNYTSKIITTALQYINPPNYVYPLGDVNSVEQRPIFVVANFDASSNYTFDSTEWILEDINGNVIFDSNTVVPDPYVKNDYLYWFKKPGTTPLDYNKDYVIKARHKATDGTYSGYKSYTFKTGFPHWQVPVEFSPFINEFGKTSDPYKNIIYTAGGELSNNVLTNSVYKYDLEKDTNTSIALLPKLLKNTAVVGYEDINVDFENELKELYIFGGVEINNGNIIANNKVYKINLNNPSTVLNLPDLPLPLAVAKGLIIGDTTTGDLYVFGRTSGSTQILKFFKFNFNTQVWTSLSIPLYPNYDLAKLNIDNFELKEINGDIVLYGIFTANGSNTSDILAITYNVTNNLWNALNTSDSLYSFNNNGSVDPDIRFSLSSLYWNKRNNDEEFILIIDKENSLITSTKFESPSVGVLNNIVNSTNTINFQPNENWLSCSSIKVNEPDSLGKAFILFGKNNISGFSINAYVYVSSDGSSINFSDKPNMYGLQYENIGKAKFVSNTSIVDNTVYYTSLDAKPNNNSNSPVMGVVKQQVHTNTNGAIITPPTNINIEKSMLLINNVTNKTFLMGGHDGTNYIDTIFELQSNNTWNTLTNVLPILVYNSTIATKATQSLMIGGLDPSLNNTLTNTYEITYDANNYPVFTQKANVPNSFIKGDAIYVPSSNNVYLLAKNNSTLFNFYLYDSTIDSWNTLSNPPASSLLNVEWFKLFMFDNDNVYLATPNNIYRYEIATDTWSTPYLNIKIPLINFNGPIILDNYNKSLFTLANEDSVDNNYSPLFTT